jgi:hypothetical protein
MVAYPHERIVCAGLARLPVLDRIIDRGTKEDAIELAKHLWAELCDTRDRLSITEGHLRAERFRLPT